MSTHLLSPIDPLEGRDALAPHRNRMMYPMAIAGAGFLAPFAINDFLVGRYLLGAVISAVVATLAIDAWAIYRKRRPPIPFPVLLIPMIASMGLSLATQGIYGAMWSFPAVLFFYFVLPRPLANIGSAALLIAAAIFVQNFFGTDVTVRFVFALALTVVIINIVLNVVSRLQQELLDQAVTDPLTGAFNRRHMEATLADAMERNRRNGAPASLLLVDIDHFKQINDSYGHDAGDRVLKGLVALVSQRSRKLDKLFRIGGEEFLLFLPDTKANDAMTRAEILRALVSEAPLLPGRPVTISIGVSELTEDPTREAWIKRADEALYAAKQTGRNKVVLGTGPASSRDAPVSPAPSPAAA